MKKENGITLVALVITIIVLLILAAVSINLVINNGLLEKAKYAVDKYSDGEIEEQIKLSYLEYEMAKLTNINLDLKDYMQESLEKVYGKDNITIRKMGKNYKVRIGENGKTLYRLKADGTVSKYEEMKPTDVYARLDDDGTLYLRATQLEGYNIYSRTSSIQSSWNTAGDASTESVLKVIVEEPIAPNATTSMFADCTNLKEIVNIKNIHTENVTGMTYMFKYCTSLKELDLSNFDTSKVNDMHQMFYNTRSLEKIDLSSFNTSNVRNMSMMFRQCMNLSDLDLTGFDTSNVENMWQMFMGCKLSKLNLRSFNTDKTTNMRQMFYNSTIKNLNLGNSFVINEGVICENMFLDVYSDIRIKATQDTKVKIIELYPELEDNFE